MFDGLDTGVEEVEAERLEAELTAAEAEISRLRSRQAQLLRRLEGLQVDVRDGSRLMGEWVASRLDVSNQTASRLMQVAHHHQSDIEAQLASGRVGIDRAALLCKIRELGGPEELIADSSPYSLGYLYGLADRLRKVDAASETFNFDYRYLVLQPSLGRLRLQDLGATTRSGRAHCREGIGRERIGAGFPPRPAPRPT